MPPEVDQDLAQLYAAMIAQQTTPTYDDGASLLQRNPAMMDVGLFGKPKPKPVAPPVDIQRRKLFGLSETPSAPVPAPMTVQPPAMSPVYKALTTPMSRRDFLKHTARAAGNAALRGALPELGALAEKSQSFPLQDIAPTVEPDYSTQWDIVSNSVSYALEDAEGSDLLDVFKNLLSSAKAKNLISAQDLEPFTKEFNKLKRHVEPDAEAIGRSIYDLYEQLPKEYALPILDAAGLPIKTGSIIADDVQWWLTGSEDESATNIHEFLRKYHPKYDKESVDARIQQYKEDPSFIHHDYED